MIGSLYAGISGLKANMSAMSVIGDNIANVDTTGFKASRVSFANIFSASMGSSELQIGRGVTLSGGDPFVQADFAEAVLDACRTRGLRTAVDTAGMAAAGVLERLAAKADLVLYDLKVMDDAKHRETTGAPNGPLLENLARLVARGPEVWVRVPLVPGVNDDDGNVRRAIDFLRSLRKVERVGLLPYHSGGLEKARRIGKERDFRAFEAPGEEREAAVAAAFREAGFDVRIGG